MITERNAEKIGQSRDPNQLVAQIAERFVLAAAGRWIATAAKTKQPQNCKETQHQDYEEDLLCQEVWWPQDLVKYVKCQTFVRNLWSSRPELCWMKKGQNVYMNNIE